MTRSPFHPCSTLDPSSYFSKPQSTQDKSSSLRLPNPELFPFLSRKLAASDIKIEPKEIKSEIYDSESLDAVDAAAVMLSLKNGPRLNNRKEKVMWQVITTSPSQDHTYSAADNVDDGGVDEAFESDEE